jgi:hypothetical protein
MVLARGEASKDAGLLVLRHQNAVLHRQISRVRCQPDGRLWLSALSRLIPRRRQGEVLAATPATLPAWHRRLAARRWDSTSRRPPGRPSTAPGGPQARDPHGHRQPGVGSPAGARRARQARPPDRSLHRAADPACRRDRSRAAPGGPGPEAIPGNASPRHPGGRLYPPGHRAAAAPPRPDHHRAGTRRVHRQPACYEKQQVTSTIVYSSPTGCGGTCLCRADRRPVA